jgi:hypothetical protein
MRERLSVTFILILPARINSNFYIVNEMLILNFVLFTTRLL